jgi:hypothetical protein
MDSEHDSDAVPSVRKLKHASKMRALSEQVKEVEFDSRFFSRMSSSLVASSALMILVTVITKMPSRAVDSFCHWG